MIILGVDPGYGRTGFAVLENKGGEEVLLTSSCLETDEEKTFPERLRAVVEELERYIKTYQPTVVALEKILFSVNKKTALKVSEVRGACVSEVQKHGIEYVEYYPQDIKLAITGSGGAKKDDIARMVPMFVKVPEGKKMLDDECDAIAIALTHSSTLRSAL